MRHLTTEHLQEWVASIERNPDSYLKGRTNKEKIMKIKAANQCYEIYAEISRRKNYDETLSTMRQMLNVR